MRLVGGQGGPRGVRVTAAGDSLPLKSAASRGKLRVAPGFPATGIPAGDRPSSKAIMPCVLIVEDDEDVRDFMDVLLRASGYETMTAANGAIGIEMMHHKKPCMVLLDMMMPVMDGWAFRSRQMADPELRGVPVVCVTALFEPQLVAERLKLRCLSKPVDFDRLLAEVSSACTGA
jgi:CheY-like chemotaxis protein